MTLKARENLGMAWTRYRLTLGLMTRIPVGRVAGGHEPWGPLAGYYPAAGLAVGLALLGWALVWNRIAPATPMLSAALTLVVWAGVTGGLHWDGWADCCDAFFTPVPPARRLEIMADPRLGGFGALGLMLLVLVKFSACVHLWAGAMGSGGVSEMWRCWMPFVVAPVAARAAMTAALADRQMPAARPGGMGDRAREGLAAPHVIGAFVFAAVVAAAGGGTGLIMLVAALAAGWGFARLALARIGGLTGDVLGGIVELAETAALTAAAVLS